MLLGRRGGVIGRRYVPAGGLTPTHFLDSSHGSASNGNAGTSASAPWASLAALNRSLTAGSIVGVKAGTSYSGTVNIPWVGTAGSPIILTSYGAGAAPSINGGNGWSAITFANSSYVVFEKVFITNCQGPGFSVAGTAHHITIRNNEVTNCGEGADIVGNNNLIAGNYIHDLHMIVNTVGGDDDYGATGVFISGDGNEFCFNKLLNCKASSFDYGEDGGGFEIWESVNGLSIHHNWVENCIGFMETGGSNTSEIVNAVEIWSNVSYNNGGFQFLHLAGGGTGFGVTLQSMWVHHNTIVETTASGAVFSFSAEPGADVYRFADNVIHAPNKTSVTNQGGSHNWSNFWNIGITVTEPDALNGNPLFTNLAGADFSLQGGSPAAGNGAFTGAHVPGLPAGGATPPTGLSAPGMTARPSTTPTVYHLDGALNASLTTYRNITGAATGIVDVGATPVPASTEQQLAQWVSYRIPTGGKTLSGTISFALQAGWTQGGAAGSAAPGLRFRVFKRATGGTETTLGTYDFTAAVTTAYPLMQWSGTLPSTAFLEDERIIVRLYLFRFAGNVMGGNFVSVAIAGTGDADSKITLPDAVAFKASP